MNDKDILENIIATTKDSGMRDMATQQLKELAEENSGEDVTSQLVGLSSLLSNVGGTDSKEVKEIVKKELEKRKITIEDLDTKLKNIVEGLSTTMNVTMVTASGKSVTRTVTMDDAIKRPLMQKILSDCAARNNVYLYGGAGTGKTFAASTIADALGWELIEVNCNQFTSALELIGGQTIDGYQEGKVIRAFGNLNEDGTPMTKGGCVLLLDELPKIDPNTAGLLNSALAKAGEYKTLKNGDLVPASIQNAKGTKIVRKNVFIMASGNSLLNTLDTEYEANFKQDLSLQDRFAGSTYEVFVDKKYEWEKILNKKWAFIYIYLSKLRESIVSKKFQAKAFVSIRLMMSAQKTYNVFRAIKDGKGKNPKYDENPEISFTPAANDGTSQINKTSVKTITDTLEEFFNLFNDRESKELKSATDFDGFLRIVSAKNKISLDKLNTADELEEVDKIINS
tara:strand:- start:2888 stop:4246 length:1359 start_codon:yes stop_codon:yes gene_type:complete